MKRSPLANPPAIWTWARLAHLVVLALVCVSPDTRAASSSAEGPNIRVDTRGRNLVSLTVTPAVQPAPPAPDGPEKDPPAPGNAVPAGGTLQFRVAALYDDASSEDVTNAVQWGLGGEAPKGLTIRGGLFDATKVRVSQTTSASFIVQYGAGTGLRQVVTSVAILPGLNINIAFDVVEQYDHGPWRLLATATITGNSAPPSPNEITWDFGDDDGLFNNGSGFDIDKPVARRSYLLRAQVQSGGQTATAAVQFGVSAAPDGSPVLSEVVDAFSHDMVKYPEATLLASLPTNTQKLAVVIHGLENSARTGWVADLANAIAGSVPDAMVVAYDWERMADPSKYSKGRTALGKEGFVVESRDLLEDILTIRENGRTNGVLLAERLLRERLLGNITNSTIIHLIGHSAGGFVAGECAKRLKAAGFTNLQVSMLDTPIPFKSHVDSVNGGWRSDRYITSWFAGRFKTEPQTDWRQAALYNLGADVKGDKIETVLYKLSAYQTIALMNPKLGGGTIWGGGAPLSGYTIESAKGIEEGLNYRRVEILHDSLESGSVDTHAFAHDWYELTVTQTLPNGEDGFFYSNLIGSRPFPEAAVAAPVPNGPVPAPDGPQQIPPPPLDLDGFTYFGTASGVDGVHTLTEDTDAGFWKTFTLPIGSETLRFRYRFTSPGDGDFIAAYWGEEEVLVIGPDTDSARAGFVEMEADVSRYGGREGTLVFKLTSRNEVNAVVEIDQVQIVMADDPDGDGLTNTEELALGSDAHVYDTDGDGLSDYDEVNVHGTSPLRADSDGDTVSDPAELALGTNPQDRNSALRPRMQRGAGGQLELRWQGVAGRTYSVVRSPDLSGAVFDFIATGVAGGAAECVVTDPDTPTNPKAFYWVLQEP